MQIKRLAAFLTAVLMLMLSACLGQSPDSASSVSTPVSDSSATAETLSLLYSMSDSLDPYKSETQMNRSLATLLYDPLFTLDTAFQPKAVLAEKTEANKAEYTVTLKTARFTDGTAVTADDVVYSLKLALAASLTAYPTNLASVKSYKATSDKTVVITLFEADPYFSNLLTFPIIKSGSDSRKDENNIALPPIGSGRYVYDADSRTLNANGDYFSEKPSVPSIKLINAPDSTVTEYNLEVGNVSIYYTDLSDGSIPPMSGNASAVDLNDLVYLGVNLSNKHLKNVEMRYALAAAIDRAAVTEETYYSYAKPAAGLFNGAWEDAKGLQTLTSAANAENVVANLSKIGYNSKDENGFYLDNNGKSFKLRLVAYSGNERRLNAAKLICEQLGAAGLRVDLVALEWEAYVAALNSGNFDLYIAETRLPDNMNISQLVKSNGSLAFGIPEITVPDTPSVPNTGNGTSADTDKDSSKTDGVSGETPDGTASDTDGDTETYLLDSALDGFYSGELSIVDVIQAFNAEMPIIPICHRCGITVCSSALNSEKMSSPTDAFFGITDINKVK